MNTYLISIVGNSNHITCGCNKVGKIHIMRQDRQIGGIPQRREVLKHLGLVLWLLMSLLL